MPCGIDDPKLGVTSLADLGHLATMTTRTKRTKMAEVDAVLRETFAQAFPPDISAPGHSTDRG